MFKKTVLLVMDDRGNVWEKEINFPTLCSKGMAFLIEHINFKFHVGEVLIIEKGRKFKQCVSLFDDEAFKNPHSCPPERWFENDPVWTKRAKK